MPKNTANATSFYDCNDCMTTQTVTMNAMSVSVDRMFVATDLSGNYDKLVVSKDPDRLKGSSETFACCCNASGAGFSSLSESCDCTLEATKPNLLICFESKTDTF